MSVPRKKGKLASRGQRPSAKVRRQLAARQRLVKAVGKIASLTAKRVRQLDRQWS